MRKPIHLSLLALSMFLACGAVLPQTMSTEDVIAARQSGLRDMGAAFKSIVDELKKKTPALAAIRSYANQVNELAGSQKFWFPAGSGPESGIDTDAKAEIWKEPKYFDKARQTLTEETAALVRVVNAGDLGAIRTQVRTVGNACKGCHDRYREKED